MSDFLSLHVLPLAWQGFLLVVLALTAAVLAAVRARIRSQLAAAALAYLTTSAATLVAGAADEVRQLKDPDKPGTWDTAAQQRILGRVVRDLWAIGGRSIEQLRAVQRLDQDSVQRLLVQLSEAQVEALRQRSVMTAAMQEPHAAFDPTATVNAPRSSLVPLAVVSAIGAALALGLMLSGCPVVREGVMRVTPGVPDRSDCAEGAYRCNANVPEACSATHRWWPTIPRDPSGAQRVCPAGCALAASGVAYCAASIDGGAL